MYIEKDKKRLITRNTKDKYKKRAREVLLRRFIDEEDISKSNIGVFAKTRKSCSCYACGNPRHYTKDLTLKEKMYQDNAHPDNKKYWK